MSQPAVSVIIPTFNRPHYLVEALDSISAQTFTDYEVIVVDDGSSEDIAAAIKNHPTQPRLYRQERQGPAAARNLGLREATGDLIAFLDSDDLWLPTKLEVFLKAMEARPEVNIFYGPMTPIDARHRRVAGRTKPCHDGWITEHLFCSSFVHVPTVVCRRRTLLDVSGFNSSLPVCEDYDLWLRLSVKEQFALIEEPFALRRLHGDRLSKSCMSRNLGVKSRVLKSFFESNTANGRLNADVAAARLAKVFFAAARASLRDGHYQQALDFNCESRRYGKSPMRTVPLMFSARTLSMFGDKNGKGALQTSGYQ